MLSPIWASGDAPHGLSAVHSGNMGDIIYALPACRRMGVDHLILNCCVDTALSGRQLTRANAQFLAPLLLAQPWLRRVEIVEIPVALGGADAPAIQGLPLEHLDPATLGVDLILDRFRWQDLARTHLIDAHAAAINTTVNADAPWLASPEGAAMGDSVVVALTGRYRDQPTAAFVRLLEGIPEVIKVGGAQEAAQMADVPGRFITCTDAGELADLIARARAFVGNPSLPYAIAEGLKVPRLVDVPVEPLNAFPRGAAGWLLPADTTAAHALLHERLLGTDGGAPRRPARSETPTVAFGIYTDDGTGFQDTNSSWSQPAVAERRIRVQLELGDAQPAGLRLDVRTRVPVLCLATINLHGPDGRLVWSLKAAGTEAVASDTDVGGLRTTPFVTPSGLWLAPSAAHAWFPLDLSQAVLDACAGGSIVVEAWLPGPRQALTDVLSGLGLKDAAHAATRDRLGIVESEVQRYQEALALREEELKRLYASRSWRLTRPLRALIMAWREPARFRRTAADWLLSQRHGQTPLHHVLRRVNRRTGWGRRVFSTLWGADGPRRNEALAPGAPVSALRPGTASGFYGGRPLGRDETVAAPAHLTQADIAAYRSGTDKILQRYSPPPERPTGEQYRWLPVDALRDHLNGQPPRDDRPQSGSDPSFAVITPFFRHIEHFVACANSVADLMEAHAEAGLAGELEWIVFNDDPEVPDRELADALPATVTPRTQILSDGTNRGIAARLNEGAGAASATWLLFLDCDDRIDARASEVLNTYIGRFPKCRFISSTMTDVDERGIPMRKRLRPRGAEALADEGMVAGHLMAVRADLFDELGGFDPARTGCQDYDLAMRTAMREAILMIPESLYFYRWHESTQSLSNVRHQARVAARIRHAAFTQFLSPGPDDPVGDGEVPGRGLCAIRTQGRRLDLLREAVASATTQRVALTAMVVVHGDAERCDAVRSYLAEHAPTATVAHAAATDRKRGHPINVAIDALAADADSYGFFCVLDDDDIYYPGFAERMLTALRQGAHVAYCASNARQPWVPAQRGHAPLPAPALLTDNFIPTNAVAVRTDALLATGCRVREDLEYLEDWDFLLQLLGSGARFAPVYETLSEYRLIGDGNQTTKADQRLWDACARDVAPRAMAAARALGPDCLARAVLAFDFARRPPLTDRERHLLDMTTATLARRTAEDRRDVAG